MSTVFDLHIFSCFSVVIYHIGLPWFYPNTASDDVTN